MAVKFEARRAYKSVAGVQQTYAARVKELHTRIIKQKCAGSEMLGWRAWPNLDHAKLFNSMREIAQRWSKLGVTDVAIVGIGGSYTGVKALVDFVLPDPSKHLVKLHYFTGMSALAVQTGLAALENKNWAVIVNSKSGTTLESALNFRLLREKLAQQYGKEHQQRIVAITDPHKGVLHDLCVKHNYTMLVIPADIGGRFSTLTAIGLLPALLVGIDVKQVIAGAADAQAKCNSGSLDRNSAYLYAAYRHWFYKRQGLEIEAFVVYEPAFEYLAIEHRQMFGESEGKGGEALFPTYSVFTTDLHSMGQLLQEGKRNFFETVVKLVSTPEEIKIPPSSFKDDDHLDYLLNKTYHSINAVACDATMRAHHEEGKVPILTITLPDHTAYTFGYFFQWLANAVTMSALLLSHNPFDQPGVESYKKLMFASLGKK